MEKAQKKNKKGEPIQHDPASEFLAKGPPAEIPEWELEEMIRDVIGYNFRAEIAERALAWLDQRVDAYKRLRGTLQ